MVLDLTIAIPVRNEEHSLPICLEAIGENFARYVVVIDSCSSDATQDVALAYGAEVINFNWNGNFPKKRNWFLRHHTPTTTWVLFLDADEIVTPAFKQEIKKAIYSSNHQAFLLSFNVYFLGRRLRGGVPLRKLSLFRVGEVEYEKIEEEHWSQCDMEVHEHPQATGTVGFIRSRIDHRDLSSIDRYMAKHRQYAAWESRLLFSYRQASKVSSSWKPHQRLKYWLLHSPWGSVAYFFVSFFPMGGWRDGSVGFAFCLLKASYYVEIFCRLRELELAEGKNQS